MKFRGFDDSTQHSQGAVELEWDSGDKMIRFAAHVVLGNSGLLLTRSGMKALGATIDLRNDQDAPGEPEDHPETFHCSSWSLRGQSSEMDQGGGRG